MARPTVSFRSLARLSPFLPLFRHLSLSLSWIRSRSASFQAPPRPFVLRSCCALLLPSPPLGYLHAKCKRGAFDAGRSGPQGGHWCRVPPPGGPRPFGVGSVSLSKGIRPGLPPLSRKTEMEDERSVGYDESIPTRRGSIEIRTFEPEPTNVRTRRAWRKGGKNPCRGKSCRGRNRPTRGGGPARTPPRGGDGSRKTSFLTLRHSTTIEFVPCKPLFTCLNGQESAGGRGEAILHSYESTARWGKPWRGRLVPGRETEWQGRN